MDSQADKPDYFFVSIVFLGLVLCVFFVIRMTSQPPSSSWPAFPKTAASAHQLLTTYTRSGFSKSSIDAPSAEKMLQLLKKQLHSNQLIAGWPRIIKTLQRSLPRNKRAFLLWGIYHDSHDQLTGFLRLLGANGLTHVTDVIVEPFRADGHWAGIPSSQQRGDNALLKRIAKNASSQDLLKFQVSQTRDNYTGWKHHQLHLFGDLTLLAKSRGRRVYGCDMPFELQRKLPPGGQHALRMRELHCALTNDLFAKNNRQTLMFWGQSHIGPNGLPRFLQKTDLVTSVYLFGGRSDLTVVESELQDNLALTVPVLLKLKTVQNLKRYALILPGKYLATSWMHTRVPTSKRPRYNFHLRGYFDKFQIGSRTFTKATKVRLPPGDTAFLIKYKDRRRDTVGAIRVMKDGFTNVILHGSVRVEYHYAKQPIQTPSR